MRDVLNSVESPFKYVLLWVELGANKWVVSCLYGGEIFQMAGVMVEGESTPELVQAVPEYCKWNRIMQSWQQGNTL